MILVIQDTTNLFRLHLPEITLDHVYTKASDREQGTGEPGDPLRNKSQVVIFVWSCRRELLQSSCSKRNQAPRGIYINMNIWKEFATDN